ncbi:helix-turn-helix domain-containing protein [Streptomyces xanthophaeus]|uniref:helix-turn-helix domain-containing protein n=1 Tax=Streptomyces xanthophaeus TaxID=67385 RepID=UPI003712B818
MLVFVASHGGVVVVDLQGLGSRIRQLRRDAGMSQADLAGDNLSPSYVSLLEAGKRNPSGAVLEQLAQRLSCDPAGLLGFIEEAGAEDLELELHYTEMLLLSGDPEEALSGFEDLREKAAADGDRATEEAAELGAARALEHCGRLEEAAVRYEALRTAARQPHSRLPELSVVVALCRCYRELGDLSHAVDLAEATLSHVQDLNLAPSVAGVELVSTLVGLHIERGDLHRAAYLAALGIERAKEVSDPRALGAVYWNASVAAHRNGRSGDALELIRQALAIYSEGDNHRALARLRNAYAGVLLQSDSPDVDTAKELLRQSADTLASQGSTVDLAYCETALARAELLSGRPDEAVAHARRALDLLGPNHRLETARTLLVLAAAHLELGDQEAARAAYERGALTLEASEAGRQAAFAWAELAEVLERSGQEERAVWAYRQGMRCMGHRSSLPVRPRTASSPVSDGGR